jgi:hypothetical protein
MPLKREIWEKDIVDNLYKNNDFAKRCVNADSYVLAGAVVHKAVAGAPSGVRKNLNNFPQSATTRADAELTYALDTYYALPRRIAKLDEYEYEYDKRMSVVGEDQANLIQQAMDGLLYRWAPAASGVILTTGDGTAEDLIDDVATGQRRVFTKTEFKKVAKKFDKKNFNAFKKTALLTAAHYHQFFESLSDAEKTNFNAVADLKNGVIGRYMGIDILMRSSVLRYRLAGGILVPVDEQEQNDDGDLIFAPQADDRSASLFYVETAVERALGTVEVFDNPGQALYYGDIFSAFVRLGGKALRSNGVIAVVDDTVAA